MLQNLSTENVLDMVTLSDLHGADSLRTEALKFIVRNGQKIVSQKGWKDKLKKYPEVVIDLFETTTAKNKKN